jgi:hypothetical protein
MGLRAAAPGGRCGRVVVWVEGEVTGMRRRSDQALRLLRATAARQRDERRCEELRRRHEAALAHQTLPHHWRAWTGSDSWTPW